MTHDNEHIDLGTKVSAEGRPKRKPKQKKVKVVRGVPVAKQEYRDAIAASLIDRGAAKPQQVAEDLILLTREERDSLATDMNNMRKQRLLDRDDNGFYSVPKRYAQRMGWQTENLLIDEIRSHGGLATWSEIMDAFDTLPSNNKETRTYGGRGGGRQGPLSKALVKSKRIVRYQHGSKAMWGLQWEELLAAPLSGRAVEWLMVWHFLEVDCVEGHGGEAEYKAVMANVLAHFENVGLAFAKAREMFDKSHKDVVSDKKVRDALLEIMWRSPNIAQLVSNEIRTDAELQAFAAGRSDDYLYVERLIEKDEEQQRLVTLLVLFEFGDAKVHRVLHASLYIALAAYFGLCPASFSRGLVIRRPIPSVLPDGWEEMPEVLEELEPSMEMVDPNAEDDLDAIS